MTMDVRNYWQMPPQEQTLLLNLVALIDHNEG